MCTIEKPGSRTHNSRDGSRSSPETREEHEKGALFLTPRGHFMIVRPWVGNLRIAESRPRIVASVALGRRLSNIELVHHCDQEKLNDDPENLLVLRISDHEGLHRELAMDPMSKAEQIAFLAARGRPVVNVYEELRYNFISPYEWEKALEERMEVNPHERKRVRDGRPLGSGVWEAIDGALLDRPPQRR